MMSAMEAKDTSKTIPDEKSTEPHFPFTTTSIVENDDWMEFKQYGVKIGNFNRFLSVEAHHFETVAAGFVFYKCHASDTYVIVVQTDSMNGNAFVGTISKSAFNDQIPTDLNEDLSRCEANVKSLQKTLEAAQQGMWTGKRATDDLGVFDSMTEAAERLTEAGAILGSASERFADAQEELEEKKEKVAQIFVAFAENYYSNNPVSSTIQHEPRGRRAEEYESPLRRERRRSYSRSRTRSRSIAENRTDSRARGRRERQRERYRDTGKQTAKRAARQSISHLRRGRSASVSRTPRPTRRTRTHAWTSAMTINRRQSRLNMNAMNSNIEGFAVLSNGMSALSNGVEEGFGALTNGLLAMQKGLDAVTNMATIHADNAREASRQTNNLVNRLLDEESD